ncbi:Flavin-containing monooxygenase [Wickerhamomyces ciferrii]|uniref:Flavin-containing monooxygenase n=1 Tax=Wickerhamomyces ciferrii (strain ATCC 14091 / BCRC 22168 / CBS 111 / JCM 3599 / NBRC 0793 / NRRL Y-1031 F-60-10) TaxID=1206466 RepID=K0KJU2_WICCF|nr:Flavin-containing monooxygenase [Wickerhamomyces ciferrii]CCH45530.1 Flavin-containing monooxygenase [Wickerhamomyces ciferrii]
MTVESFDIKKIAIIGGGVAGIAALNELLHTSKDGISTFDNDDSNPAFEEIVLFERNDTLGGNWYYSNKSDPVFPSQDILNDGNYNKPETLDPPLKSIPNPNDLKLTSLDSPIIKKHDETVRWSNSAAYPALFSNIIAPLVRLPNGLKHYDSNGSRSINPFSTAGEIHKDLYKVVQENQLNKFIRFQTTVEKVEKSKGKWNLVLRKTDGIKDYWYQETFDAIITANGHYSVPFIPFIENLNQYNQSHPNTLLHTKGIKNFDQFQNQNVLIIGSHSSSVDVIKFLVGSSKSITVSRRTVKNTSGAGIEVIFEQPDLIIKPKIKEFDGSNVIFVDDSIGVYDKIIFATGYHFHYPFLKNQNLIQLGQIVDENSKFSLIKNLYLYAFSVDDPTFTTIGIQQSPYLFATIESQAAAIAGVWSNFSKLPSKEFQLEWLNQRNVAGDFHIYNVDTARENLADLCIKLAPKNRKHPFDILNVSKEEVQNGWEHVVRIYNLFKSGKLTYDKVIDLNNSK